MLLGISPELIFFSAFVGLCRANRSSYVGIGAKDESKHLAGSLRRGDLPLSPGGGGAESAIHRRSRGRPRSRARLNLSRRIPARAMRTRCRGHGREQRPTKVISLNLVSWKFETRQLVSCGRLVLSAAAQVKLPIAMVVREVFGTVCGFGSGAHGGLHCGHDCI